MNAPSKYSVPNLERALEIMEYLAGHPDGLGNSQIADALGFPRNSVFRITATLCERGYLRREESNKTYTLTPKLLAVGHTALNDANLIERSLDVMRELRDAVGETVLIGSLAGHQGVVLDQVAGRGPVKVLVEVGHLFPLHTSAPGKAMLAQLPEAECERILERMKLARFTANTITSKAAFRKELARVRRTGYAADLGEEMEGLHCVGAPILDFRGHPIAAIWTTGPKPRLPKSGIAGVGKVVIAHAQRISARYGAD